MRLNPNDIGAHYNIGLTLLFDDQPGEALVEFKKEEDEEWRVKGRSLALHALGRFDEHKTG